MKMMIVAAIVNALSGVIKLFDQSPRAWYWASTDDFFICGLTLMLYFEWRDK